MPVEKGWYIIIKMRKSVVQSLRELNQFNRNQGFLHYREQNLGNILMVISTTGILLVLIFHVHDLIAGTSNLRTLLPLRFGIITYFLVCFCISVFSRNIRWIKRTIYAGFYVSAFYSTLIALLHGGLESSYWGGLGFLLLLWFIFIPFPYRSQIIHGAIFIILYYFILYLFKNEPVAWMPVLEWSFFMSGTLLAGMIVTVLNNRLSAHAYFSEEAHYKAENALRAANERLSLHIQNTPLAFIEWNMNLEVVEWNPAAEQIFGYTKQEVMGKQACELIVPEHQLEVVCSVWDHILNHTGGSFNVNENTTKDGKIITCEWYNTPLKNKEGHFVGLASMAQDISARKRMEADLAKSMAMLEKDYSATVGQMKSYFSELQMKKNELLQLQKENLQSQFEMLKNQVNPHFLFNSLNILTSLISVEPELAEKFTGQLSKVYRYVLEHRAEDLVKLRTELEFLKSYIFLLTIRFGDKLEVYYDVDEAKLDKKLPPLSLQMLTENAIRHNFFTNRYPLIIDIFADNNNYLNVVNNYQKREQAVESNGIGLSNIANRYSYFTDKQTYFGVEDDKFVAKIPLI